MREQTLSGDTVDLLKDCDSGCRMATESMEQMLQYVTNPDLNHIIMKYNEDHIQIGDEIHRYLNSGGERSEEPGRMALAFAKVQSGMRMTFNGDSHQAAAILTDGCNMGIKSLNESKNKYGAADDKSVGMCDKLIRLEKNMCNDLQAFL